MITCTGFAVAQKIWHTSGHCLTAFSRLMGYAPFKITKNVCPLATRSALSTAAEISAGSLPSERIRQGPEASQNAMPNFAAGAVVATISARSSTVLMKCACPRITLLSAGRSSCTVMRFIYFF